MILIIVQTAVAVNQIAAQITVQEIIIIITGPAQMGFV
tara:strand:+ start:17 stop:130 length:114 start_codon:yes stop_codon:yes gene_type:complete